jgi:hypothetical protein
MKQPKKPIGLSKPKKITVKRAYEVADSLENLGYQTIRAASKLKDSASKNKSEIGMKGAEYLMSSGMKDVKNSERYRNLANKVSQKKK